MGNPYYNKLILAYPPINGGKERKEVEKGVYPFKRATSYYRELHIKREPMC